MRTGRPDNNGHRRLFVEDVHGGTLVFKREVWQDGSRYPHRSIAEDAWFLAHAVRRGARLTRLKDAGVFMYVRHGTNAWQFAVGEYMLRVSGRLWSRHICATVRACAKFHGDSV